MPTLPVRLKTSETSVIEALTSILKYIDMKAMGEIKVMAHPNEGTAIQIDNGPFKGMLSISLETNPPPGRRPANAPTEENAFKYMKIKWNIPADLIKYIPSSSFNKNLAIDSFGSWDSYTLRESINIAASPIFNAITAFQKDLASRATEEAFIKRVENAKKSRLELIAKKPSLFKELKEMLGEKVDSEYLNEYLNVKLSNGTLVRVNIHDEQIELEVTPDKTWGKDKISELKKYLSKLESM